MTTKTLDLAVSGGAPFIWGSVQDTLPLNFVYSAAPMLSANPPVPAQGTTYLYDSRKRLRQVNYASGRQVIFDYDEAGNRNSVTVN
jgi:YD repeat-containing protein